MPISITNENYAQEIEKASKPVVIDVFATWCGPCQQMAPIFDEVSQELGDTYLFAKLDIDEARDIALKHSVASVPTFIFLKDGNVVAKETGYMNKDSFKAKIKEHLG